MSLNGNLSTLPLADLMQTLAQGRKSGTLVVEQGRLERKIFFEDGEILACASSAPEEHLGAFLVDSGLVDEPSVEHAMRLQRETKIHLGRVLVTMGLIEEAQLHQELARKAEETISALLTSPEGRFEFLEGELPQSPMVPASLNVIGVILASGRRIDEQRAAASAAENARPPGDVTDAGSISTVFERTDTSPAEPMALAPLPSLLARPKASLAPAPTRPTDLAVKRDRMRTLASLQAVPAVYKRTVAILGGALLAVAGLMGAYYPRGVNGGATGAEVPLRAESGQEPTLVPPPPEILEPEPNIPKGVLGATVVAAAPEREESPEVLQQIEQLFETRAVEIEASVRGLYEAELAALRQQLEKVQQTTVAGKNLGVGDPPAEQTAEAMAEPASRQDPAPSVRTDSAELEAVTPVAAGKMVLAPIVMAPASTATLDLSDSVSSLRLGSTNFSPSRAGSGSEGGGPIDSADPAPVVVKPQILRRPEPRYPPAARLTKNEGTVIVRVLVGPNGKVVEAEQVTSPLGFGFDLTAVEAARRSKWSPGTRDGVPTAMWAELRFDFRL